MRNQIAPPEPRLVRVPPGVTPMEDVLPTDSVNRDEYNQRLSEQRGAAVRDYLTQEGMAAGSVTAKGLGETQPVTTNDTAKGRQQNRRVELVISGEVIGAAIGTPLANR